MFSRYIDKVDFKSRFRILKGGKVSLVVSAMVLGCAINVTANVTTSEISTHTTEKYDYTNGDSTNVIITNTGSISVSGLEAIALEISGNPLASGYKLENNGIISVEDGQMSAGISSSQTINGTINNFGTINTNAMDLAYGIAIGEFLEAGTIENKMGGNIIVSSTSGIQSYAWGIYVDQVRNIENVSSNVTNAGTLSVDSVGKSYGISVSELLGSNITNSGTLNVNSASEDWVESRGIYIDSKSENTYSLPYITNSGTMTIRSNAIDGYYSRGFSYGIAVDEEVIGTQISNTGTIDVEAESEIGDTEASSLAYGINLQELKMNSSISNTGTIEVVANAQDIDYSYGRAYGIKSLMVSDSTITNSGDILVESYGKKGLVDFTTARGIDLEIQGGYDMPTTLANSGTISAKTFSSDNYSDSYGVKINNTSNEFALTNSADGIIEAYLNDKLDKKAYSLYVLGNDNTAYYQESNNLVNNVGTLKGNMYVQGTLKNSGTIELAWNANSEDSAFISNFTNKADGILKIGLNTDDSGEVDYRYSQLGTDTATFEDGSTIAVNVLTLIGNQNLLKGQTLYNVVTASTALTIENKLNITDNSALLDFSYATSGDWENNGDAGNINLIVAQGQTVEEAVKNISPKVTQHTNAQGAANALDRIIDNIDNNPQMQTVITRLNQLSSNEAVARAVESTTPVAANATVGATTQISNGIAGIVTQRQNANISAGGMNSGDGMFSENNMWIKPFGSIGSQNNKDGINGFDVKTYGLGFGADTEYKNNQKLGLAFFYTNANVDVNNMNQNADLDVFTTLVYGNVPIIDDRV